MNNKTKIIGGSVAVIVAVIIGVVASSLKKLSTEEAGLQYDVHLRTLKKQVYTAGLHLGPPGYRFITFPKVFRTIDFNYIKCLNKDGLEIQLSVQFQYLANIKLDDLELLILSYEEHDFYKKVISDTAQEVIHDTCSLFNVTEFQTSRVQFQNKILDTLNERLKLNFKTSVRSVQVSNIQRPLEYEKVVRDKESAKQNIQVAIQERPRILTAANTKKREAETEANITLGVAQTNARIMISKAHIEAQGILNAFTTEAKTFEEIKILQNLTVSGLLSYITTRAIQTADKPVYVNLENPTVSSKP